MHAQPKHHVPERFEKLRTSLGCSLDYIGELLGVTSEDMARFAAGAADLPTLPLARLARLEDFRARLHDGIARQLGKRRDEPVGPDGLTATQMLRGGKMSPLECAAALEAAFLHQAVEGGG